MIYRVVFALVCAVALAGCFNPKFKDQIACGTNGECPPDMVCGADSICHTGDSNGTFDASPIDGVPDAIPDAPPVECNVDADCATPPDACSVNGRCDLTQHLCVFEPPDCSAMADDCNEAACDPQVGCIKAPAHQGSACGAGNSCAAFGMCGGFGSTCDSSGTRSRTCTMYTCQSGACTGTSYTDSEACSRTTNGTSCGARTYSNCGTCSGSSNNGCAADGDQTCSCVDKVCQSDACTSVSSSCTRTGCKTLLAGAICGFTGTGCLNGMHKNLCCNSSGSCSVLACSNSMCF